MELLDQYFKLQKEIYDYFGYVEDWVVIPLQDNTLYYWSLDGDTGGSEIRYAIDPEDFDNGNCYCASVYSQRFLPQWVYSTKQYTMVCADTHCDGNKFLMVFDNTMQVHL